MTFKELYEFLQLYEKDSIIEWLEEKWKGKDKQESLLRLFAGLDLIEKLKQYDICKGNFNLKHIKIISSIKDVFYDDNNELIKLKDKGDSSDLSGYHKVDKKNILVTTSKNINKMNIGKLDIDKILTNFKQYEDIYTMTLCICIRDRKIYENMKNNVEKTNVKLKDILEKEDTIIIDWNDLNQAYNMFKITFVNITIKDIIDSNKPTLCLKMHQQLGVIKSLKMKNNGDKKILWGHIQRSGKSYIIGGCIIEDSKNKKECNYLVMTMAPKETIEGYKQVFNHLQFKDFNIIEYIDREEKYIFKKKNIIICSEQFLRYGVKIKNIKDLSSLYYDIRFLDESHYGGTSKLAQKTLEIYGDKSFTVQITATYSKPTTEYNIPRKNWILWDLEDIKLLKDINNFNINKLIKKHGEDFNDVVSKYSEQNIIDEYSKYPELQILTHKINSDIVSEIINKTKENNYGWSSKACFLLKKDLEEFQNEEENLKIWYLIFGKRDKFNIPDKDFPDDIVFMKRIEAINCKKFEEPSIIMAFLPQNNIDDISKTTKKLLEKYNVIPEYEIDFINSNITNDPIKIIENARDKAKNGGKKGVLILSGRQCSLGVSIKNCNIVILLNNNKGFDMIYQMMFRCMTEEKNKKYGFVIDLDIHRVIETSIIQYATLVKPNIHPKKATKYILKNRLITLNGDHWLPQFGKVEELCDNIYNIYASNTENALKQCLERIKLKEIILTKEEQKIFNKSFSNSKTSLKNDKEKILNEEENIKKGIEKIKIEEEKEEIINDNIEEKVNYVDVLKHIIPLICLLTINNEETNFVKMYILIKNDEYIFNILIDQIKSWWGKNINTDIINLFINTYIKYMKDDKEINQIIRTVKEVFVKNVGNRKELSNLIDKYFIPQELEKKTNAEVSTPFKLRQEMLDKIPIDFWKEQRKVFEPCSGKGGFLIDIIDRFMIGLEDKIKDEKERYKVIVEECLYFSDINPTNIFICKLLINNNNKYKINYNEGNTLELDIKKKWKIEGFDAVIGNPPYNDDSGNKGKGHTLWTKFIEISLEKWILKNGYLLYVNPSLWRQADHPLQNIMKKYQIEYLEIHNESDGVKIFKCNTRYDWYIIKKIPYFKNTKIKTQKGDIIEKDLTKMNFIPNYNYELIDKLTKGENKINMLYSRSDYASDKKWTSKIKNKEFKYPVVYSVNRKNQEKLLWSSINNKIGHYNTKKVIFGSGATGFIIDYKGEYACCEFCTGIIDDEKNLIFIKDVLNSEKFKNEIILATSVSKAEINRKILKYFKKDFWKEFI